MSKENLVPKLRFEEFINKRNWRYTRLKEVANIVGGGTPSTQVEEYWNGDINWFSPTEIDDTPYLDSSERKITKLGLQKSSAIILPVGTVLFTSRAGIGKTAILAKEATTNQGFQSIIPQRNKLNSYFIYSRSKEIKYYAEAVGAGSTFVEVSGKELEKMLILVPVLAEQQKIGSFFKKIDQMIQLQQSKVSKAKDIKSAYLSEMFPKEGEKYPKKRFEGFTEPWNEESLGNLSNITTGSLDANAMNPSGKYDFYTSGIQKYKIDTYAFEGPAITIAGNGATVGYMHLADGKFNAYQRTYILTQFHAIREFLYLEISRKLPVKIRQEARMGNIPYIVMDMLVDLSINLPSNKEQKKIGKFFKNLDNQISIEEEKLNKLEKLKQAYLNDMFV